MTSHKEPTQLALSTVIGTTTPDDRVRSDEEPDLHISPSDADRSHTCCMTRLNCANVISKCIFVLLYIVCCQRYSTIIIVYRNQCVQYHFRKFSKYPDFGRSHRPSLSAMCVCVCMCLCVTVVRFRVLQRN